VVNIITRTSHYKSSTISGTGCILNGRPARGLVRALFGRRRRVRGRPRIVQRQRGRPAWPGGGGGAGMIVYDDNAVHFLPTTPHTYSATATYSFRTSTSTGRGAVQALIFSRTLAHLPRDYPHKTNRGGAQNGGIVARGEARRQSRGGRTRSGSRRSATRQTSL
jgi:hypothetical protein